MPAAVPVGEIEPVAFVDSLGAMGAAGMAPLLAQLAVSIGCLLMAVAVISAFGRRRQRQ